MAVTRKMFQRSESMVTKTTTDREGKEHGAWVLLALFYLVQHINGGRYLSEATGPGKHQMLSVRQNILESYQTPFLESPSDFRSHRTLAIQDLRRIPCEGQLYVNCDGSAQIFFSASGLCLVVNVWKGSGWFMLMTVLFNT